MLPDRAVIALTSYLLYHNVLVSTLRRMQCVVHSRVPAAAGLGATHASQSRAPATASHVDGCSSAGKGGNALAAESRWGAPYPTQFKILLDRAVRVRRFQAFSTQDILQFLVIGACVIRFTDSTDSSEKSMALDPMLLVLAAFRAGRWRCTRPA